MYAKQNFSEGFVRGFEVDAAVRLDGGFSVFGVAQKAESWADWLDASGHEVRAPLTKTPPASGTLGLRWEEEPGQKRPGRFWAEFSALIVDKVYRADMNPADWTDTSRIPPGGLPGYTLYNARVGWRLESRGSVTLGIDNISNKDYRVFGSGVNGAGTNVILATQWNF